MSTPQDVNNLKSVKSIAPFSRSAIAASALAICLAVAPAIAAQNRPGESLQQSVEESPYGESPYGSDVEQGQADNQQAQSVPAAPNSVVQNATVPATLHVPAGTIIPVRTTQWLSSDQNRPGDTFSATLEQPLVVNGWVVARRGQSVIGRVAVAEKAGRGKSNSQLGLELSELILVDGQQLPVSTALIQNASGQPSADRQVGTVAITTAIGAAIGAAAGGGQGAAIGAAAGAGAGIIGVMSTRGRATVLAPETMLTFRLQSPLEVSTERSQVAFRPVTPRDYGDADAYARLPRRNVRKPSVYYYGRYYAYPGAMYFGFYSGRSFGPWVGVRGGFHRGIHR